MRPVSRLTRKVSIIPPKRKFIVFTEGKNTEPDYLKALNASLKGAILDLKIVKASGVPQTIAKLAVEEASTIKKPKTGKGRGSSFEEGDQVWAVFDRDEHPNVPDALQKCDGGNVGTAFSNPCFELWLILHIQEFDKPDDRHQVQKALTKICESYDHNNRKTADCDKLVSVVEVAESRAEKQLSRRNEEGEPISPPFTTVFKLTRAMRAASAAHEKKS